MKKIFFSLVVITSFMACDTKQIKPVKHDYPSNATGYTLDSTANTDLVKKALHALIINDTITYKDTYSSNAIFHHNTDSMNLSQNMAMIKAQFDSKIEMKIFGVPEIWELVNNNPDKNGINHYVLSFIDFQLTKGGRSMKLIISFCDLIKDGKQVEEYLIYDKSSIAELMK